MRSSLQRHVCSNACTLRSVSARSVHVSQPWRRIEATMDVKCLYVVGKLMEMLVHNLLSLAIAAVAMEIRMTKSVKMIQLKNFFFFQVPKSVCCT
ncbi:hypothetical protein DPMN_147960 [Dreissena polymorpha]|uniref:Uncharacterized protein n=1 Tax=Dreissena polymorpha TaxID=45954 RepID=A0A9D4F9Y8_DREPO|nr:hypothetical protein DPMN_147960 [Dreissena polymorpha]